MSKHLTEQQLIDFQFKLSSEHEMKQAEEHVKTCETCRSQLEKVVQRLSILDELKDDYPVSDQVVEDVISRVQAKEEPVEIVPVVAPAGLPLRWIAAVAAILMLIAWWGPWKKADPKVAGKPPEKEKTPYISPVEEVDLAQLRQEPPFPPASAIELNVLPKRDHIQLSIYNSADLTLVRERRKLTMKKGWNWLQFMWANTLIDPTSLTLEPMTHRDKIDVEQLVFPPRLKDLGRWLMFSEISGEAEVEITYLTSGISWRAFYMGTLTPDEQKMRLDGYVRVSNRSGEEYENAETRLVVGKVNLLDRIATLAKREQPYGKPMLPVAGSRTSARRYFDGYDDYSVVKGMTISGEEGKKLDRKVIKKQGLSEYFLYTIEGRETIPNGWDKRLPSFSVEDISVVSRYKYDEGQWGRQVIRFVAFANDEEHKLGETPIPNGQVRIFGELEEDRRLGYVGAAGIKYIPVDEKVELNLGAARKVMLEPRLMDLKTDSYQFNEHKDMIGWDVIRTWELEVRNTRELPIEIEITRGFDTAYWDIEVEDAAFEKHDATHVRFNLKLGPRSKQVIRYTVRTYHGTRETER